MHTLSALVQRIAAYLEPIAARFGWPGLLVVAFLDSSFLSLPEVTDALIVFAVVHDPSTWLLTALAATAGSVGGCYALYALARRGGHAFLRKRFHERHVDRGLALFRKYGLWVVVVPSVLPPPAPFKIFVLLAGVAEVRPVTFAVACAIGRGLRYGGEAWLAYRYGDYAMTFIRQNLPVVSAWAGGILAVVAIGVILWQRRRAT